MESLKDKVAVVGGGTGRVGEGIVRSFLAAGANVVVPVRSEGKTKRLEEYVADLDTGSLTCLPADVSDFESAMNFRSSLLEKHRHLDVVVACMGSW